MIIAHRYLKILVIFVITKNVKWPVVLLRNCIKSCVSETNTLQKALFNLTYYFSTIILHGCYISHTTRRHACCVSAVGTHRRRLVYLNRDVETSATRQRVVSSNLTIECSSSSWLDYRYLAVFMLLRFWNFIFRFKIPELFLIKNTLTLACRVDVDSV